METIDSFSSRLSPAEKILVYNSVILPRRVHRSSEFLVRPFTPFFNLILSSLDDNPCINLIDSKKFSAIQVTLKKWMQVQNNELLDGQNLHDALSSLAAGESFPLFLKSQNCCLIFHEKNDDCSMFVSAFQVNASNQEITEGSTQLHVQCPSMTVRVKNEKLLKSRQFSELLADLCNSRNETCLMYTQVKEGYVEELNDIDLPFLVFEWILPLITENNVPVTDRVFVLKKYSDSVVYLEDQYPFRRNPIWISIKSYFHLRLIEILGSQPGRVVFKVIMLKVVLQLCQLFDAPLLENVFECLKKTAKKIKKIEDLVKDNPLIQNLCNEGKKIIRNKRENIEKVYIGHVLALEKKLKIIHSKFSDFDSIHYEIDVFSEKVQEILSMSDFFKPQSEPVPKKFNRLTIHLNLPKPGIFRNCNETELRTLVLDFELWVKSGLKIQQSLLNELEIDALFDLLNDYIKTGVKMYEEDPVGYSTMILTAFKLLAVIDKNACDEFPLLEDHKLGVEINKFTDLLLPTSSDLLYAKEIIEYYSRRQLAEYSSLITLPKKEETSQKSFARRFFNTNEKCQVLKNRLALQQTELIKQKTEIAKKMSSQYKRLKQEYDSRKCSQVANNQLILHDEQNCRKCFLLKKMKKMTLELFEKFLPEEDWKTELIVFEICIPRIVASVRDAVVLVRTLMDSNSKGKKVQGLWLDQTHYANFNQKYQKIVKLGSSFRSYMESYKKYKDIQFYLEDPDGFIVDCGYNLKLCAFDSTIKKPSTKNATTSKSCRFNLENKHKDLQWIIDDSEIAENQVIAEVNKCPQGLTIGEFRSFGLLKSGSDLILLRILEALETRSLPFREVSTCYLITQSLWKLNSLKINQITSESVCPETQLLFTNNYFLNQLHISLKEFFLNNEHNWGEHLLSYVVVVVALRYVHFSTIEKYTKKMIKLLKYIRKTLIKWQEKIENMQNSNESNKKSVLRNFRSKLFQVSCICLLTYCTELEYFDLVFADDHDFLGYLQTLNRIRNLTVSESKTLNSFEHFLIVLVNRFCLGLEKNIIGYVTQNKASPLRLYLRTVYRRDEDKYFHSFQYSPQHYGFFVYFKSQVITQTFIGLDGKFLVNGLAYSRLPDYIINEPLFKSYFKNTDLKAYCIETAYETETRDLDMLHSCRYQFKILEDFEYIQEQKVLIVKEILKQRESENISILIPSWYFCGFLPTYFINSFSHWLETESMKIEFREKTIENLNFSQREKFCFDVRTMMIEEAGSGRLLIMMNSRYFRYFYDEIFYRIEQPQYTHIFFDENEQNFYFEFPRHSLTFVKKASSSEVFSKEFSGYKISLSQNVKTLFGLDSGLVLEKQEKVQIKKKLLIPNASYKLADSEIHQKILHDFTAFNTPSFYAFDLDERLQIIKGEESIESWLYLAYLHAITSSMLPDPFLGRQGTARSLEILQSGHCFSSSPLSAESRRILSLISDLSPKRHKVNRVGHQIQKIDWPKGLSSAAASDLFVLLSREIINKNSRLNFLYPESTPIVENETLDNSGSRLPYFNKELYLMSYRKEVNQDFKLASWFEHEILSLKTKEITMKNFIIGEKFGWLSPTIINIRKISTQSYKPSKDLDLLKDFENLESFSGLSEDETDFTKMSNLVNISKNLFNHWINLYNFSRKAPKESLLITLTGLAYLDVNIDYLLLFQMISNFPKLTENLEIIFSDEYSKIDDFQYKKKEIIEILNKNIKIRPEDNPQKSKKNFGESESQFIARTYHLGMMQIEKIKKEAESSIKEQWPSDSIEFNNHEFDVKAVKNEVLSLFLTWFKNLQLRNLLQYLTSKVPEFKYLNQEKKIELEYQKPQISIKTQLFSPEFESVFCKNLLDDQEYQEISAVYNKGLIPDENLVSFTQSASASSLYEFPFDINDSSSDLKSYFIKDLKKSWDFHISSLNTSKIIEKDKYLKIKLKNKASFYKMKSARLQYLLKASTTPSHLEYLSDSFVLASFHSSRVLSLLRAYQDSKTNPTSSTNCEVDPLEVLCGAICVFWSLEQRILRCLYYLSKNSFQETALSRELETIPFSNWRPKDYPLWLILQVETDMMIRPVQVSVAESMISPSSQRNTVMQLNMGEGKTSLIIPMVVLVLANKSQLVRLTVLKSLFNINKAALAFKLGGFLNRRIYSIPCKRDLKFEKAGINLINQVFKECLAEKGVFLTLPDQRFSFILKGMELSRARETAEDGKELLRIQSRLDQISRDLLDESDEILNPKYQLIYTVGKQNTVQGGSLRWTLCQAVLECMQGHLETLSQQFQTSIVYERYSDTPQRFPTIRLINQDPYRKLCGLVAQSVLWGNGRGVNFPELRSTKLFNLVFKYVTSESITLELHQQVFKIFESNESQRDAVVLLKGLLSCQILLASLTKRWRVNYGVNTSKTFLMQAVPFRAKDVPADKSQFAHPDIAILLTQLSYFYSGLNNQQLDQVLNRLNHEPDGGREYESWINEMQESGENIRIDPSVKTFKGINLNDQQQKDDILFPLLSFNQRTINYWLNHFLYPKEAKQFQGKLSLSFWDLCIQKPFLMTGFSGTNDSKILLPLTVDNFDVPGLIGTNGSLIYDLLRPENSRYAHFKSNVSGKQLLAKILKQETKRKVMINVLLDVGALMLELTNLQVIREWLKIRKDAKAAVCFDESNNLIVLNRNQKVAPFESSPFRSYLVDCLVYLDDSHTRGTDLKIPKGTVAAVTLGKGVNKDKLMQGCMRMRMLGKGHSVMFFASSEVHNSIQLKTQGKPSGIDVLKWSLENTVTQTSDNFLYWGLQGISYFKRQVIYEKYFKSDQFQKYSEYSEEPELPDIRILYGGNRKETPIPTIIKSKTFIIKKKLEAFSVNLNSFEDLCQSLINHSSSFVSTEKKFAHLLDEEQELELEIEVEVDAQVEKQKIVVVKPERHSLEKDVKLWFESGDIPGYSPVFQKIPKGLGITSLRDKSQPFAWSPKIWLTLDFMRTVDTKSAGDYYLKPVRWLGFSGSLRNPKSLVVLSSFEANTLMRDYKNGPVKLFLYCPRTRSSQMNLFSQQDQRIPLDWMQNLNVFAGNQYFSTKEEVQEFTKFVGYSTVPRTEAENEFYLLGMIRNNGYVEPEFRKQVFGDKHCCDFNEDPAELALKIIEIRNFGVLIKFCHIFDILVYGRRPELKTDS